jgi:hypothetical protein
MRQSVGEMVDPLELMYHDAGDAGLILRREMRIGHLYVAADTLAVVFDDHVRHHPACDSGVALAFLAAQDLAGGETEALQDRCIHCHILWLAVGAEIDDLGALLRPVLAERSI